MDKRSAAVWYTRIRSTSERRYEYRILFTHIDTFMACGHFIQSTRSILPPKLYYSISNRFRLGIRTNVNYAIQRETMYEPMERRKSYPTWISHEHKIIIVIKGSLQIYYIVVIRIKRSFVEKLIISNGILILLLSRCIVFNRHLKYCGDADGSRQFVMRYDDAQRMDCGCIVGGSLCRVSDRLHWIHRCRQSRFKTLFVCRRTGVCARSCIAAVLWCRIDSWLVVRYSHTFFSDLSFRLLYSCIVFTFLMRIRLNG